MGSYMSLLPGFMASNRSELKQVGSCQANVATDKNNARLNEGSAGLAADREFMRSVLSDF